MGLEELRNCKQVVVDIGLPETAIVFGRNSKGCRVLGVIGERLEKAGIGAGNPTSQSFQMYSDQVIEDFGKPCLSRITPPVA